MSLVMRCAAVLAVAAACSSSSTGGGPEAPDAAADDAGADAGGGADAGTACDDACRATALTATFGAKSGGLERAQHGVDHGDAGETLHVEAHHGGDPACPTASSPTPDRTFVLSGVPSAATAGASFTQADGVTAAFLDFKGDVLPDVPLTKATKVTVKVVAADRASPPAWIALDVDATFAEGNVKGHAYAERCASLDD